MSIPVYTPSRDKLPPVVHKTSVDFVSRSITRPVHLVQYDNKLPLLQVQLLKSGVKYPVPSAITEVNIRVGKPDGHFVINSTLGTVQHDASSVYFEILQQMVTVAGEINPVVELKVGDDVVAASSPIPIIVDPNPVTQGMIESSTEYMTAKKYAEQATASAEAAKKSETNAAKSETNAARSETNAERFADRARFSAENALESENNAAESEYQAEQSAKRAKYSETLAAKSETNAEASEINAARSETNASKSEKNAKASETNAARSETNAAKSEANAKTSEVNAKASETNAARSETNSALSEANAAKSEQNAMVSEYNAKDSERKAHDSSLLSQSWAVGGTGVRNDEDMDNSQWYSQLAKGYTDTSNELLEDANELLVDINHKLNLPVFSVDDDMNLIYTDNTGYIFSVDDDGNLNWEVA